MKINQSLRLKAVILDMDGLMVDSEPLSRQAWSEVLATFNTDLEEDVYFQVVGWRLDETASFLQQRYHLPIFPGELARIKEERLAEIRRQSDLLPMPGLSRLLVEVEKKGLAWAVATSSKRATAEENLARLDLLNRCHAIAGGDEVTDGKPAPDIYLLAADRLDVFPYQCLALEDSVPGARSAKSAGLVTVAVPGKHARSAEFSFADYVFDSLNSVVEQLDRLVRYDE